MARKLSATLQRASEDAQFVFTGTIVARGRNNLQGIAAAPDHALVRVERVHVAPGDLGPLVGRTLTVVLLRAAAEGGRATFWARSWIYADEIGVVETARSVPERAEALVGDIVGARLARLDAHLAGRVAAAAAIVRGRVRSIEPIGIVRSGEGTHWSLVHIIVATVHAGEVGAEVVVLQPGVGGPRWRATPRLAVGQDGVFLLQRPPGDFAARELAKIPDPFYLPDPDDVQGPGAGPRVELLSARNPDQAAR